MLTLMSTYGFLREQSLQTELTSVSLQAQVYIDCFYNHSASAANNSHYQYINVYLHG